MVNGRRSVANSGHIVYEVRDWASSDKSQPERARSRRQGREPP